MTLKNVLGVAVFSLLMVGIPGAATNNSVDTAVSTGSSKTLVAAVTAAAPCGVLDAAVFCEGTELPYANCYWRNHEPRVCRCVCCGKALFSFQANFDSGTEWPGFWSPIANENIRTESDLSLGMARVEVLCFKCDAHLGHVSDDGPPPRNFATASTRQLSDSRSRFELLGRGG